MSGRIYLIKTLVLAGLVSGLICLAGCGGDGALNVRPAVPAEPTATPTGATQGT